MTGPPSGRACATPVETWDLAGRVAYAYVGVTTQDVTPAMARREPLRTTSSLRTTV